MKVKPHHVKSVIADYIDSAKEKASIKDLGEDECFLISLKHFDRNQSPSFSDWEEDMMLSEAVEALSGYCHLPLTAQIDGKKFVVYGDFPKKSKFTHPSHVPQDAKWGRIHVNGEWPKVQMSQGRFTKWLGVLGALVYFLSGNRPPLKAGSSKCRMCLIYNHNYTINVSLNS